MSLSENQINEMLAAGQESELIARLEEELKTEENEMLLFYLGELYFKTGKMIEALKKFNAVLKLNPQHRKAVVYATMINDILDFYHKDLLNP